LDAKARIAQLQDIITATPGNPRAWVQARPVRTRTPAVWVLAVTGDQWNVFAYASHQISQGWALLAYMPQGGQKIVVHLIRRIQEANQ
jgi:hypothetical protein